MQNGALIWNMLAARGEMTAAALGAVLGLDAAVLRPQLRAMAFAGTVTSRANGAAVLWGAR